VIQVHAVDARGRVVAGRALARGKFIEWCVGLPSGCVVATEASSSAHHSSGGKNSLGGITKRGDTYLCTLLIQGAKSAVMTRGEAFDADHLSVKRRARERGAATEHDWTSNFPARREIEDVLNRSDRRWASSTNPWGRSVGSDHVMGMEPHRAVRIWVRIDTRTRARRSKAVCRVAVCSLSRHRLRTRHASRANAIRLRHHLPVGARIEAL